MDNYKYNPITKMVEHISVQRGKLINDAVLGEIIEIAKENEIFTTICLNEKEIIKALREYMEKQNPKTNYDRIKSMSVEEMTALITKLAFFPCELCEREHNASCTHEDCFNIHKQWLLQEVSENDR